MKGSDIANEKVIFSSCNICGSDKYDEICDIKISPIATPSKLVRCKGCGLFYANPRLEKETEEDFYKKHYHERGCRDLERVDIFKRTLDEIEKFSKKGRLIDIGCGMGHFMKLAGDNGWEVKGVEISDFAISYAQKRLKQDVIKGSLKDAHFEEGFFDVATMWNVLDQIYDPRENLIETNRVLKKGGYLFIRASNVYFQFKLFRFNNILRAIFRNFEDSLSVFHLYSFDRNSIKNLLESAGFSNVFVKIEPLSINNPSFVGLFGKRGRMIRRLIDSGARLMYFLSFGNVIVSPSLFVIAQKNKI